METQEGFKNTDSPNHVVFYNGKIVDMGYSGSQKDQFKYGCMRIYDNLGTGKTPTNIGFIKTPSGEIYEISRDSRRAKKAIL